MEGSTSIVSTITGALADLSTSALGEVFTGAITIAIPCVIAWFGYRFLTRKASSVFKSGKL